MNFYYFRSRNNSVFLKYCFISPTPSHIPEIHFKFKLSSFWVFLKHLNLNMLNKTLKILYLFVGASFASVEIIYRFRYLIFLYYQGGIKLFFRIWVAHLRSSESPPPPWPFNYRMFDLFIQDIFIVVYQFEFHFYWYFGKKNIVVT